MEKETITDTNKVLSEYEAICEDGITCKTNGNTIEVTATKEEGAQKITAIKEASGTDVYIK